MSEQEALSTNRGGEPADGHGGGHGVCGYVMIGLAYCLVVVTFPLSMLCCIRVLQQYERAVIFRLGIVTTRDVLKPGLIFKLPCVDEVQMCDIRTKSYETPRQQMLTSDSASVTVDGAIHTRITYSRKSLESRVNIHGAVSQLVATQLRRAVGGVTLAGLISERKRLSATILRTVAGTMQAWGVHVQSLDIGVYFLPSVVRGAPITLPSSIVRALATEAETSREAKAKMVAAKGEVKASRLLKQAADMLSASPAAMELRYLQTLRVAAADNNHTVILPFPPQQILHGLGRLFSAVFPRRQHEAHVLPKHSGDKKRKPTKRH